jgi:hypothetical protein
MFRSAGATIIAVALGVAVSVPIAASEAAYQPDRPVPFDDSGRRRCGRSDLVTDSAMVVTRQSIDTARQEVTMEFLATTENVGTCFSAASRTKAVLTLAGGRWLGQDNADIGIVRVGALESVTFSITFPYTGLLDEECRFRRDDIVLTVSSDFLDQVTESDESNNQNSARFSSDSTSLCAAESGNRLPGRERPFRDRSGN